MGIDLNNRIKYDAVRGVWVVIIKGNVVGGKLIADNKGGVGGGMIVGGKEFKNSAEAYKYLDKELHPGPKP